jgi:hypothetical protein
LARGRAAAARVIALFRAEAHQMHLIDCSEEARPPSAPAVSESADDPGADDESQPGPGGAEVRGRFVPAFGSVMAPDGLSSSENKEPFT